MNFSASAATSNSERTTRTWAEVDLAQLSRNAEILHRLVGENTTPVAVIKADAYGHGAVPVARAVANHIAHFAVATVAEAAELRRAFLPHTLYILSPFLPQEAGMIVDLDAIPMVSSWEQWDALSAAARDSQIPARCFLKFDSGMGRSGASLDDALAIWQRAKGAKHLRISGIATHFSSADEEEPDASAITETQISRFFEFVSCLNSNNMLSGITDGDGRGNHGIYLSLANSPATLRFTHRPRIAGVRGYLARVGLLLYGIAPYREAQAQMLQIGLLPVLTWKARITLLRDLPVGATLGYGRTHTLKRSSRIATIAAGYADGMPRVLSNRGQVLVKGQFCPIVGRVSMDQCQIDVTDITGVTLGDTATIIGEEQHGEDSRAQTAFDIAEQIETTPHEPTCNLSQRVPRLYVRSVDNLPKTILENGHEIGSQ